MKIHLSTVVTALDPNGVAASDDLGLGARQEGYAFSLWLALCMFLRARVDLRGDGVVRHERAFGLH